MASSLTADVFTIAVEGNIGCGKSTFLKNLGQSEIVTILPEPVRKWQNCHGHDILGLMYRDTTRWSFLFQSYVQKTMLENHTCPIAEPIKIMERSIHSAQACFVQNSLDNKTISLLEYEILQEWFNRIFKYWQIKLDLVLYLRADPEICRERITKRSREGESGIPLEYLKQLHSLHEIWLNQNKLNLTTPVIQLNANGTPADVLNSLLKTDVSTLTSCNARTVITKLTNSLK